ncbi:MAG: DivIVA domain-containing protein [Erysipelotrichaceae bacterium]|nr:DivIVA domain-containing protein [Erysipelotrichaceae bacterium]MDY5251693.1 DivIVA domain-containing protein [Erysipelotrichaceae bacterium]
MVRSKPAFRVMRNGYDRFAVDAFVEDVLGQINDLENELADQQRNNNDLTEQLNNLKDRYQSVMSGIAARERAADDISRIAIQEANQIIGAARKNADIIVQESLYKAKIVLNDLVKISNETGTLKKEMREQLDVLMSDLNALRAPNLPDLSWLDQAIDKDKD